MTLPIHLRYPAGNGKIQINKENEEATTVLNDKMTASERLHAYLKGDPVDRAPAMEWAPWWNETVDFWHTDGLPAEINDVEAIQEFFALDKCLQTGISPRTALTPQPAGFGLGILEDEEDYEKKIRPTLFPAASEVISEERYQYLEKTHARGDTVHFFTTEGFFWYPRTLFGIEPHLYSFYDQPELLNRINEDYLEWLIPVLRHVFERFRFDFMSFAEDMSYNGGPMISKETFDEFLAPFYRRVIPVIHEYGIPVFIDSDGDITKAVDWYASVGADGMFPLERKAGVDVSLYIKKQPAMAFLGHFDKMCMKYGEEAMRKEFERLLPSMQYGKLIPAVDHQTPPDVTVENYRIYVRLLREYTAKITHEHVSLQPCPVMAGK